MNNIISSNTLEPLEKNSSINNLNDRKQTNSTNISKSDQIKADYSDSSESNDSKKQSQQKVVKHTTKSYIDIKKIKEPHHKIAIGSFPRSGNTMIRTVFENIIGHYTGDDMVIADTLGDNILLSYYGLGKESEINNVLFVKTHYPFMCFEKNKFNAQGAFMVIRNPFDSFLSFFHFSRTSLHQAKVSNEELFKEDSLKDFDRFINFLIPHYRDFHTYWLNDIASTIPTKVFRYEDFVDQKSHNTKEAFDFLSKFEVDPTYLNNYSEKDINDILTHESDLLKKETYKPNNNSTNYQAIKVGIFTEKHIMSILETCWEVLEFFNYIEDFLKLNDPVLSECINKIQKSKKNSSLNKNDDNTETKTYSSFKVNSIKELEENNEKLIMKFKSTVQEPIKRPFIVVNDDAEGKIVCQYDKLWEYWNNNDFNKHLEAQAK